MAEGIRCQNCNKEIQEDDLFITCGKALCEDCYIDVGHRIKVCDPWGERSKRIFRESHGLTGTDGLTDQQKRIYEFIKSREKITMNDLAKEFKLSPVELENEFAILRHCQLVKGKKEENKIYLVLW
jgi:late competence protein required for DNA uptake (superfamily II DNA/RNA helicase)